MSLKNKFYAIFLPLLLTIPILFGCSKEIEKIPITTNSQEARELYLKGLSLNDRLRGLEAIEFFEEAIALDSNFAMAYIGLSSVQQNPNQFFANFNKASSLKDQVSAGERLWIEAVEQRTNNQTNEVRLILQELIKLYPFDERAHNFLATTYFGSQEYQTAINHYLKVLEINPKFSQVYNQLGYAYRFLQNYKEAEKMFQQYIELIPNDPNPYDSYGELLMQMGEFNKSLRNYEKALSVNPNFTFSFLGIASNLNYQDKHVEARNRLQKFLSRAKTDAHKRIAYNGIITSYIDEGNLKAALKMTQKMNQIAIENNDTITIANEYIPMGILYLEIERFAKAEEVFNKAIQFIDNSSFPEDIKINNSKNIMVNLAFVDLRKGQLTDARKKADEYFTYASEQNNLNQLRLANQLYGMIAFNENNYESSIEFLRKSNQNNPYNIYRIALAYEQLGDIERAQSYFSKAANANLVSNRNYSFIRKKALAKISTIARN